MTALKLNNDKGKTTVSRALHRFVNGKSFYLLGAFFLPIVIMSVVFMVKGVYPLTDESVLVLDLDNQYVYFFEAIRNVFRGDGSLFYSWYRALGGEFSGIYAYYVASPFALLSVLFPENGITEFILCMSLLKVGSCGLTFALYLHNSRPSKPLNIVIFSTCYALSGYAVAMISNTMWIDSLIYLPLICLGIERVIKRRRPVLYCVTLALCFMSNFYIGWMSAIFSTLYFFYYYLSKYTFKDFKKFFCAFYTWLGFTLVAAMIAAVIIIPAYFSLQMGKSTFTNPSYALESKLDYLLLFVKMLPNSYDTLRQTSLPYVYCGIICLLLLPAYFVSKRISGREKIVSGIIVALMVFSLTASTVDMFWHGLQKPQWMNGRYSFMFCFLIIVFAYEAFRALDPKTYRAVLYGAAAIGVLLLFIQMLPESYFLTSHGSNTINYNFLNNLMTVWFSVGLLAIILPLLWAVSHKKKWATAAILFVVCLELAVNGIYTNEQIKGDVVHSTRENYVTFRDRWSGITRSVQESDDSLYRMEKTVHRKVNDNMMLSIRGVTNSTSTLNASVIKLLNKMGYAAKSNWSRYVGGNIVNDSLLGIKYVMKSSGSISPGYELYLSETDPTSLKSDDEKEDGKTAASTLYAYKNVYALPVMYVVSSDIKKYDIDSEYSSPDVLNSMVSAMVGHDVQIYEPIVVGESNINAAKGVKKSTSGQHIKWSKGTAEDPVLTIDFTAEKDGEVYFYLPSDYQRSITVKVKKNLASGKTSTVKSFSYFSTYAHYLAYLGTFKTGDSVTIEMEIKDSSGNVYIKKNCGYVYYFNKDAFLDAYNELSASLPEITYFSETKIKAKVNMAKGDDMMFTSIPYDEGWSVKVDGKKIDLEEDTGSGKTYRANNKAFGSLLAFEVPEGEHTIELSFTPHGFKAGVILCSAGIIILGFVIVKNIRSDKKRRKRKLTALQAAYPAENEAVPDNETINISDKEKEDTLL